MTEGSNSVVELLRQHSTVDRHRRPIATITYFSLVLYCSYRYKTITDQHQRRNLSEDWHEASNKAAFIMSFLGLFRFKVLSQSTTTTMSRCFPSSFLNHHNRSLLPSWCSSPASQLQLMSLRFKSGVKTNSGAKKRFRVRGSGSIKRYALVWW